MKKSGKKRKRGKTLPNGSFEGTGGRPTKLTPEIQERIVAVIRANCPIDTAAAFAGIDRDSYHEWMKRGAREERGIYREFSDKVKLAMAEGEVRGVANIQKAANGYDVLKTRTVTEQKPVQQGDQTIMATVTTTTEERSKEFHWPAQAWLLERRFPHHWAKREFIEMGSDPAKPLKIDAEINIYDPFRMAKLIAAFADVQLIPPAVIEMIEGKDFTSGNGQGPD